MLNNLVVVCKIVLNKVPNLHNLEIKLKDDDWGGNIVSELVYDASEYYLVIYWAKLSLAFSKDLIHFINEWIN